MRKPTKRSAKIACRRETSCSEPRYLVRVGVRVRVGDRVRVRVGVGVRVGVRVRVRVKVRNPRVRGRVREGNG